MRGPRSGATAPQGATLPQAGSAQSVSPLPSLSTPSLQNCAPPLSSWGGVAVGVAVGVLVGEAVGVFVGTPVGVSVGVAVVVAVAVLVAVGVLVGVAVGVFGSHTGPPNPGLQSHVPSLQKPGCGS
jgi:hypothetical protein